MLAKRAAARGDVVGGLTLATNISQFARRVDDVVTQTLYPAICAVKDVLTCCSDPLEVEPAGTAVATRWAPLPHSSSAISCATEQARNRVAVPLIITFGINAAINQIGFKRTALFRARGETKPVAVADVLGLVMTLAVAIPLLVVAGLTRLGGEMCIATLLTVALRRWYLRRLFGGLPVIANVFRGIGPPLRAVRIVVVGATYLWHGALLGESLGYLRGRRLVAPT